MQLSEALLIEIGIPMGAIIASIHEKRDEFRRILRGSQNGRQARHAIRAFTRRTEVGGD